MHRMLLPAIIISLAGCGSESAAPGSGTAISLSISSQTPPKGESGTGSASNSVSGTDPQKLTESPQATAVQQLIQRASAAVAAGSTSIAIESLSQGIGITPENAELFRMRADVYVMQQEMANARADYSTAIRLQPENSNLYNVRGYFLMSQGLTKEATADFEKSLQLDPQNAAACNNRGLISLGEQNYDQAVEYFNRAVDADRKHADAWNNRGYVRMKQKNYAQALEDVQQAIRIREDYTTAWNNCGLIHMQLEDYAAAEKAFSRLIELSPMDARWFNHRRAARLKLEHFADAQNDAQQIDWLNGLTERSRMAANNASSPAVWIRRGQHLMNGSQYGAAIQDFSRALSVSPGNPDALTGRAVALMHTGDLQKAMQDCDESIVSGSSAKALSVRGDLWLALKNYDQAIADFEEASRFDDKVAEAYELRAGRYRETNEPEKAEADLKKAQEIRAALNGTLPRDEAASTPPAPFPDSAAPSKTE